MSRLAFAASAVALAASAAPAAPPRAVVRQGDVLLVPVPAVPDGTTLRPRDRDRVILAYGEVTGHAHQIASPDACGAAILELPPTEEGADPLAFLRLDAVSQLVHEEHATIPLAPGVYEVRRQREYRPDRLAYVAD